MIISLDWLLVIHQIQNLDLILSSIGDIFSVSLELTISCGIHHNLSNPLEDTIPPGEGIIGAYCGDFAINVPILEPNFCIGSVISFVIFDWFSAAITAIHKTANQKSCKRSLHKAFQVQLNIPPMLSSLGLSHAFHIHFIVNLNHQIFSCGSFQTFVKIASAQLVGAFDSPWAATNINNIQKANAAET